MTAHDLEFKIVRGHRPRLQKTANQVSRFSIHFGNRKCRAQRRLLNR